MLRLPRTRGHLGPCAAIRLVELSTFHPTLIRMSHTSDGVLRPPSVCTDDADLQARCGAAEAIGDGAVDHLQCGDLDLLIVRDVSGVLECQTPAGSGLYCLQHALTKQAFPYLWEEEDGPVRSSFPAGVAVNGVATTPISHIKDFKSGDVLIETTRSTPTSDFTGVVVVTYVQASGKTSVAACHSKRIDPYDRMDCYRLARSFAERSEHAE